MKNSSLIVGLSLTLVVSAIVGCAKEDKSNVSSQSHNLAQDAQLGFGYELKIKDPSKLDGDLLALYAKIQARGVFSFMEITNLLIDAQVLEYQRAKDPKMNRERMEAGLALLNTDLDEVDVNYDPLTLKVEYEEALNSRLEKNLIYNRAATSVGHIVTSGKLQCYSGTMLHEILARSHLGAERFNESHAVIIFEPGHVLPGYMIKGPRNIWHLYGLETTANGRANRYFGSVDELKGNIRVVDANDFAIVELFKNHISNKAELVEAIVQATAKKYGFTAPSITIAKATSAQVADGVKAINSTPFAFGHSPAKAGDQARAETFEMKNDSRGSLKTPSDLRQLVEEEQLREAAARSQQPQSGYAPTYAMPHVQQKFSRTVSSCASLSRSDSLLLGNLYGGETLELSIHTSQNSRNETIVEFNGQTLSTNGSVNRLFIQVPQPIILTLSKKSDGCSMYIFSGEIRRCLNEMGQPSMCPASQSN